MPIKLIIAYALMCTLGAHALSNAAETTLSHELQTEPECFFVPPNGWEIVDPSTYSPRIKIAFFKKSNKGFCPSINLAVEETDHSLNDYLKAVKSIHERDRKNHWRALGKVKTSAGLAQLTEIDSPSEFGPLRMLQLILMKEKCAYILTAAALKEDFSEHYKEFQSAFRSLELTTDLLSSIPQLDRRELLKNEQNKILANWEKAIVSLSCSSELFEDKAFQKEHWLPFQKILLSNYADMGPFWQALVLRHTQERLHMLVPPSNESQ